jgi:beta-glucosidase
MENLTGKRVRKAGSFLVASGAAAFLLVGSAMVVAKAPHRLNDWPAISSPVRKDAAMEARIAEIVAGMTLEQKIGQMTQAEIRSVTPTQVRQYYLGSILNGGGAWPRMVKHSKASDWAALSHEFYAASMSTDMKTKIPVIWGTDAVHGHNNLWGTVLYPHNIGLGAAHDPLLVGRIARATAKTVRQTGITWVFAPTLAVAQNPRWGRTYESYSSDPNLIRSYARSYVEGLQGLDMASGKPMGDDHAVATAKHFIGDGGTHHGDDQGETRASLKELINIHGAGYYGALESGAQTVMISYSSWKDVADTEGRKMHGNRELISGALKGKMGFDGLVVSDWNAIEQVPGCTRTHCPQAINAGIDLFMIPDDWKQFIAETIKDVETGAVPMARIDDAVTRILRVKMRSGLFAKSPILPPAAISADNGQAKDLAREAVRKSLVLLKNNRALPLKRGGRILVVGEGATRIERQTGGWSMTWQGTENSEADFPNATNILEGIREIAGGTVDYSADGKGVDVSRYDSVIAVASEEPYAEMKGDIDFPTPIAHSRRFPADLAMLDAVSGKGVPVITILLSGRPLYVNDLMNRSDAFVAAWLPGTEGGGVADGLFYDRHGKAAPALQGRLPFVWPGTPCPASGKRAILFPRGYGLTYQGSRKLSKLREKPVPEACPAQ